MYASPFLMRFEMTDDGKWPYSIVPKRALKDSFCFFLRSKSSNWNKTCLQQVLRHVVQITSAKATHTCTICRGYEICHTNCGGFVAIAWWMWCTVVRRLSWWLRKWDLDRDGILHPINLITNNFITITLFWLKLM